MKRQSYKTLLDLPQLHGSLKLGDICLIAVSGGADSICLLHAMHDFTKRFPLELHAIYVNHLIRGGEAMADWDFVQAECRKLRITAHYREIEPVVRKPVGQTTEEYFRKQRYRQFEQVAGEIQCQHVALGHSADDLSESFLMHMLRGAGLHGLTFTFASPCGSCTLIRPLWQTPRTQILAYLSENEHSFRSDETNASLEFTRNKIRHVLIPLLENEFNPSIRETLQRTSRIFSAVHNHLHNQAMGMLSKVTKSAEAGLVLEIAPFLQLSPGLQIEVVDAWLEQSGIDTRGLPYRVFEDIAELARVSDRKRVRATGFIVARTADYIMLLANHQVATDSCVTESTNDDIAYEELARRYMAGQKSMFLSRIIQDIEITRDQLADRVQLTLSDIAGKHVHLQIRLPQQEELMPAEAGGGSLPFPLIIRNRLPGDRVSDTVKLKAMLINDKIPYFVRDLLVVIADTSGKVWNVIGMERINARLRRNNAYSIDADIVADGIAQQP